MDKENWVRESQGSSVCAFKGIQKKALKEYSWFNTS